MEKYDYTKLKGLREEKRLTQKQLGEILFITQGAYNKLEKGLRKNDSIHTIERLAEAFELTPARLISILTNQQNIRSSGIKESDAWQVQKILKSHPLREDEFIFFTADLLDLDKYSFKSKFIRMDDSNMDSDRALLLNYPPPVTVFLADEVGVGFEHNDKEVTEISIWLGKKRLGRISEEYNLLISELVTKLMISRVLLIENEETIPGFIDMYMKVVFIATNAVAKTCLFDKGRFNRVTLLTEEEIKELEKEEEFY